jgi:putative tryptophan/tyrosine transport system substrate-binding protein
MMDRPAILDLHAEFGWIEGQNVVLVPRYASVQKEVGHEPQDREFTRHDDPPVNIAARRRSDSMMNRRRFLTRVAPCILAAPIAARAQQRAMWRIGFLRQEAHPIDPPFWDAMRGLGWVQGTNVVVESRYASSPDELPTLAAQLVALRVDVIIAQGVAAVRAAMQATLSIPILFWTTGDPVANGLVASLARPGGNVTGFFYGKYSAKVLEVLKDALPNVSRVATPAHDASRELLNAAGQLRVTLSPLVLVGLQDLARFFSAARAARADAVLFSSDVPWVNLGSEQIAAEALRNRMPSIGESRLFVESGGLLAYGPAPAHWRTLAPLVDKIFKDAKPMDIPVQQPTLFELYINSKTADALGISIPKSVQIRAEAIIR